MLSTRKGQSITLKACDYCRERKIKCSWTAGGSQCAACTNLDLVCSFQNSRKRRGRPNRRTEKYRHPVPASETKKAPIHIQDLSQADGNFRIEHLCPVDIFEVIVHDYLEYIYPIAPIVHRPSFRQRFAARSYEDDPAFFSLCISLCAMTVASLPGRILTYGFEHYSTAAQMVSRACQLVMANRLTVSPDWAENPTSEMMISTLLLGTASHYTCCSSRGWVLLNESIHCCRSLGLYLAAGYECLTVAEREVNKRAFWLLFIVQIHDRLSHQNPHTPLTQNPILANWEFLIPLEVDDEYLSSEMTLLGDISPPATTPIISGFVALIKVFACLINSVSIDGELAIPQPVQRDSAMTSIMSGIVDRVIPEDLLVKTIERLDHVISNIPDDLKLFSRSNRTSPELQQFEIMKANIHITKLYLQSWILDRCPKPTYSLWNATAQEPRSGCIGSREDIARQLLQILKGCSRSTLESHGSSLVVKIREIAAALIDCNGMQSGVHGSERPSQNYISCFLDILAVLDIASQQCMAME